MTRATTNERQTHIATTSTPGHRRPRGKLDIIVAELASLRMLLAANGIRPPPTLLDDGWLSPKQFAIDNGINLNTVYSRIRRGKLAVEERGGRIWVKVHKCTG